MNRIVLIILSILMFFVTGCSQTNDKGKAITAKSALHVNFKEMLNSLNKANINENLINNIDDKSNVSVPENVDNEQNLLSNNSDGEETATSKQITSPQFSQGRQTNDDSNQQSTVQKKPKRDTSQEQQEQQESVESVKPVKPMEPELPSCDDTIPADAYPTSKENEICSQIESEIIQNTIAGKPTFEQYEIEYGYTACGTKYFYIIPIY